MSKGSRIDSKHVTGIAILADEEEWRALAEQNPLFEFADYQSYLVDIERRIRMATRAGRQVLVGPLMPDQFETRADAAGLPRESPRALKEYERFVAELGPLTRPWTGEPIAQVLHRLRAHVRAETLQSRAIPALSAAADLHENPDETAQRAMARAAHILMAIAEGGGDGQHELRMQVSHPDGDLEYTLPYSRCGKVIAFPDDGGEHMAVVLLAVASLAERPGSMTLRSRPQPAFFPQRRRSTTLAESPRPDPDPQETILRGWRLGNVAPQPMSEGQLFAFVCTSRGGEPKAPEPGTRFRAAFPLNEGPCPSCP
ncbi:MAG TPA: hypothetical protein VFN97_23080 [Actinospica sp.]|nr:hypothetical protein [Actinospica sp.]